MWTNASRNPLRHTPQFRAVAILVLPWLTVISSCGSRGTTEPGVPGAAPYMAGRVTSVVQSGAFAGSIRVESNPSSANAGLKAVAKVDA